MKLNSEQQKVCFFEQVHCAVSTKIVVVRVIRLFGMWLLRRSAPKLIVSSLKVRLTLMLNNYSHWNERKTFRAALFNFMYGHDKNNVQTKIQLLLESSKVKKKKKQRLKTNKKKWIAKRLTKLTSYCEWAQWTTTNINSFDISKNFEKQSQKNFDAKREKLKLQEINVYTWYSGILNLHYWLLSVCNVFGQFTFDTTH